MKAAEHKMPATNAERVDRLATLLQRLASEPRRLAVERDPLPVALQARLAALLEEIDSIVLPRRLHLRADHQDLACLVVSHRRLVAIEMPGRAAVAPGSPNLAQTLAARLVEIAERRGALSLSVARRAAPADHAEVAVSVAALRSAVDLATRESAYDRLIRLIESQTLALLRWTAKGSQVQFTGAPALRITLHAIAESYMEMAAKTRADAKTGAVRTEALMIPVEGDLAVVVASFGKQGFVSVLRRQTALELIAAWQSRG